VGAFALSDVELLSLLLGTGVRGERLSVFAARVLDEAGGLSSLGRTGVGELTTINGLGLGKASRVIAAMELGRRVMTIPLTRRQPITSSRDVDRALRARYARAEREHFVALPLDAKNRPIAELVISVGSLAACPVAPADVFRPLLRQAALGVIFVHNHPSGEPSPSPDDIALTGRLCAAGALLGVRVVDHIILGDPDYFSFLDSGLLGREGEK
jgi:DNA repair protein RadC